MLDWKMSGLLTLFPPSSSLGVRVVRACEGRPSTRGRPRFKRLPGTSEDAPRVALSQTPRKGSTQTHAEDPSGASRCQPARSAYWLGRFRRDSWAVRADERAPSHVRDVFTGAALMGASRLRGRAPRLRGGSLPRSVRRRACALGQDWPVSGTRVPSRSIRRRQGAGGCPNSGAPLFLVIAGKTPYKGVLVKEYM